MYGVFGLVSSRGMDIGDEAECADSLGAACEGRWRTAAHGAGPWDFRDIESSP
jgi:hypothetical protein